MAAAAPALNAQIFVQTFSAIESYQGESPLPLWFFGFARRALDQRTLAASQARSLLAL